MNPVQSVQELRAAAHRSKAEGKEGDHFTADEMLLILAALDEYRGLAERLDVQMNHWQNAAQKIQAEKEAEEQRHLETQAKWAEAEGRKHKQEAEITRATTAHRTVFGALDLALKELENPSPEREKNVRFIRETWQRWRP